VSEYHEAFPVLRHVVLEESWVLQVWPAPASVVFGVEAVLTQAHPLYRPPVAGELFSYARGELVVGSGRPVEYRSGLGQAAVDAVGTLDRGHIDLFQPSSDAWWVLSGDWGELRVDAPVVDLVLER
jgi:hypothetical protein